MKKREEKRENIPSLEKEFDEKYNKSLRFEYVFQIIRFHVTSIEDVIQYSSIFSALD